MTRLTHYDPAGRPRMVDVGQKPVTMRVATAEGTLVMLGSTLAELEGGRSAKGDPLAVARLAGVQAAKRTADLVPMCHLVPLSDVDVQLTIDSGLPGLRATATASAHARTGVEMEALTAVSVALLAAYDMLKALERGMRIEGVRLLRKSGGRSGEWRAEGQP